MTESSAPSQNEFSRTTQYAILGTIVVMAMVVRLLGIANTELSIDETYEVARLESPVADLLIDGDGLPPLYPLALKAWCGALGGPGTARSMGVVFGCAAVVVMWYSGLLTGGFRTAMWSSLLLATAPLHVHYCREARPYSLYFLGISLVILSFVSVRHHPSRMAWAAWIGSCLLSMYSHYYSVFPIAVLALGLIKHRGFWKSHGLLSAMALPALYLLWADLRFQQSYGAVPGFDVHSLGYTYFSIFSGYSLGPSIRALHHMPASAGIMDLLPWIALVACLGSFLMWHVYQASRGRWPTRLWIVLVTIPVLLAGLLGSILCVGYEDRYVMWLTYPVLLGITHGVSKEQHSRWLTVGLGLTLALFLWANWQMVHNPEYWNEEPALVAKALGSRESQLRIVTIPESLGEAIRYSRPSWTIRGFPAQPHQDEPQQDLVRQMLEELRSTTWMVTKWPQNESEGSAIIEALEDGGTVKFHQSVGHLAIYKVSKRDDQIP